MEEIGQVVEIRGRLALVSTEAKDACHSCSARGVCHLSEGKTMVAEAWNPLGAQVGDMVRIQLSSRSVLAAAFLLYIVPLLVFLAGLMLGRVLIHQQIWAVLLGLVLMAGCFMSLQALDGRIRQAGKFRPEIFEIVTRGSLRTSPQPKNP